MTPLPRRSQISRFLPVASFLLFVAGTLPAQSIDVGPYPIEMPPAVAGVPYDYTVLPGLDELIGSEGGVSFSSSSSGNIPPGLTVSGVTRVSGVPTRPGTYTFEMALLITASGGGEQFSYRLIFNPTLVVGGSATGGLSIDGGALSFNFTQGATATQTRTIRIVNKGAQARSVSATAASLPGRWLSASGGASVPPFSSASLTVTANPAGLLPGVFSGSVDITATGGNEHFTLPAVLAVAGSGQNLSVTQTGLTFEVQQGSPVTLTQTFQVAGTAAGSLAYSTVATVVAGDSWLQVTPASGNASAASPATMTATVSAAKLTAGQYYGQIEVRAESAANSPRTVNVVLSVLPASATVTPVITPTAIVMVQKPNVAIAPQTVTVTNVSANTIAVNPGLAFDGPVPGWFSARASAATAGPGQSITFQVARETAVKLAPGIYTGSIALRLGTVQRQVQVLLVIPPVPGNTAEATFSAGATPHLDGCTPTKLLPVFTTLGTAFAVTAAWPSALEMRVVDDCGDPLTRGAVTVSFSDGEPPLPMTPSGDGRWSGTWQPRAGVQNVVLTADAQTADTPALAGNAQIGGSAANNTTTPVINAGGVLSAAALVPSAPLAPGSYVSIFGKSMATGLTVANGVPFPTDLAGTQVIVSGKRLPLQFAADGQINAVVPYDVPINVGQLLVVRRGNALSMPEPIVMAQAQPAVFTKNQSGGGEGIVVGAHPDGSQFLVAPNAPLSAGDALIIYCSGLGPVDPPVAAGAAAPSDPLAKTTSPVTVTVGGKDASVFFAGLAPGFAGLYQVNALLPAGVTPGAAVELVLSVAGRTSRTVTVAVK